MVAQPQPPALGTPLLIGFIGGIIFWGGFNTGMGKALTPKSFVLAAGEMRNTVYEVSMETVHC